MTAVQGILRAVYNAARQKCWRHHDPCLPRRRSCHHIVASSAHGIVNACVRERGNSPVGLYAPESAVAAESSDCGALRTPSGRSRTAISGCTSGAAELVHDALARRETAPLSKGREKDSEVRHIKIIHRPCLRISADVMKSTGRRHFARIASVSAMSFLESTQPCRIASGIAVALTRRH